MKKDLESRDESVSADARQGIQEWKRARPSNNDPHVKEIEWNWEAACYISTQDKMWSKFCHSFSHASVTIKTKT